MALLRHKQPIVNRVTPRGRRFIVPHVGRGDTAGPPPPAVNNGYVWDNSIWEASLPINHGPDIFELHFEIKILTPLAVGKLQTIYEIGGNPQFCYWELSSTSNADGGQSAFSGVIRNADNIHQAVNSELVQDGATWNDVRLIRDPSTGNADMFVNGTTSATSYGTTGTGPINFRLGSNGFANNWMIQCAMRNVKVFGAGSTLLHHWKFDEGSGFTSSDQVGGQDMLLLDPGFGGWGT